jgi:hypothetical protein
MSLINNIDKNLIEDVFNSNEFKGWLLSRRWFGDKSILSNLEFGISLQYFEIISDRIMLTIIKVKKPEYQKTYFLPVIYYKNLDSILEESEKNTQNILKLTENTFSKKIALTVKGTQKIFTLNLVEAEFFLFFWQNILFEKKVTEEFPDYSLELSLYQEQFQDEENMEKVQNLIEASIYSNRYKKQLTQLAGGNTSNLLFRLDLINVKDKNKTKFSYVLKSYKEFSQGIEPTTLFVLVKNEFPNAPKIYGTLKILKKETVGILENVAHDFNLGDMYWNELNQLIEKIVRDMKPNFNELEDKSNVSDLLSQNCPKTRKVSSEIGNQIINMHKSLLLENNKNFKKEKISSEEYLDLYSDSLNLMIERLQDIMKKESQKAFYNLPKVSSLLIDTKDLIEKFQDNFQKREIQIQPVHQDLHMENIIVRMYNENENFKYYFLDFEGDPQLGTKERIKKFPSEKDFASILRSLSYIKFNSLLRYIEKYIIDKEKYEVPEEVLYSLFFRKTGKYDKVSLNRILSLFNYWEQKYMNKILKDTNLDLTLLNIFTIERILHEIKYEILFRPNKFIIPLLGLKELIEKS